MSDLCINIRFWYWHLQVTRDFKHISFKKNYYFVKNGLKGEPKIKVCEFFNLKK
jgi:hypothetical protein